MKVTIIYRNNWFEVDGWSMMMKLLLMMKCWVLSVTNNLFNSRNTSPLANVTDGVLVILSRKSNSGSTVEQQIIFSADTPHQKSLAAGLLLKNELMLQDVDYLENDLWVWLEFREQYLKEQLELHGDLVCAYCGKPHLEIGGRTPQDLILNNKNPNLATIDHIVALANGGEKYYEKNLCVSCRECNQKKGTKPLYIFLENKNIEKL
jgi:5-methylcytosine-specific restriction endonuclease McrA